jgi:hypothetical protein
MREITDFSSTFNAENLHSRPNQDSTRPRPAFSPFETALAADYYAEPRLQPGFHHS